MTKHLFQNRNLASIGAIKTQAKEDHQNDRFKFCALIWHSDGATQRLARKVQGCDFSRRALHGAQDIPAIAATLFIPALLWTAMAQPLHPKFSGVEGTQGCVYLGRAGSLCPEHSHDRARNAAEENCVLLGRAGRYCPSSPSRH